ncbi:MAG TPA: hypothetical protein VFQ63_02095 [Patescibacteria group bacterium]|nr:hypothetical protein [Patescibacteria group bacterium]
MKKLILGLSTIAIVIAVLVSYSAHAFADDRPSPSQDRDDHASSRFNPDGQLSQSSCGKDLEKPVIDVTQKVQNDADSGQAGNYWAFDYYTRHIKVWTTKSEEGNTYCAIVTYDGKFYTVPGQIGPGNDPVGAVIDSSTNQPVNGDMSGGRRATIVGTLLTTPSWPTHGSVGTTNYQCNISGNCPGVISWAGQYFAQGYSNTDVWWGWKYTAGSHGTWINAITGNSGNIL